VPAPLFLIAMLAAPVPDSRPITVTGHAWAPFISPMGEPFRAHSPTDDTLADWFYEADRNRDEFLTAAEMQADAERFFAKLDTDHNGEIDPDELAHYEYDVAPDIQVMSRTKPIPGQPVSAVQKADTRDDVLAPDDHIRGHGHGRGDEIDASLGLGGALQGAARYALLNIPEPVAAADADFNRGITLQEFRQAALARFALLDTTQEGRLTLARLEAIPHAPNMSGRRQKRDDKAPDSRIGNPLPRGP
jgi:hypothetical protein